MTNQPMFLRDIQRKNSKLCMQGKIRSILILIIIIIIFEGDRQSESAILWII